MNQFVIMGRLESAPKIKKINKEEKTYIEIAVKRADKDKDGNYATDLIEVMLWDGGIKDMCKYLKQGDMVGIRGRIEVNFNNKIKKTCLIAEKITFLSSKKGV